MSHKYTAQQGIQIYGANCGAEIELKMVVDFTVHPGCPATIETPAELPSVEIDGVRFFDGKDELTLPWSIADRFTSRDEFKDWVMQEAIEQHEAALDAKAEARREELWLEGRANG
jgi:hypothetical protein